MKRKLKKTWAIIKALHEVLAVFTFILNEDSITPQLLDRAKRVALRCGLWKKIPLLTRRIIDLTIKTVKGVVKSPILKKILSNVLREILENDIAIKAREIGHKLAARYVKIALKWGNKKAREWLIDEAYIEYLGFTYLKTAPLYQMWIEA